MPLLDTDQASHLLRRSSFGAQPEKVAALAGKPRAAAVAELLAERDRATVPAPQWVLDGRNGTDLEELRSWWLEKMWATTSALTENLALFWHGYFATRWQMDAVNEYTLLDTYRRHGRGPLSELLVTVSCHPVMLRFLSSEHSSKTAPVQNFARELLELYTIGAGNVREADVLAMSRAWTGWRIGTDGRSCHIEPAAADTGPKRLLGQVKNWSGPQAVRALCNHPSTRHKIAAHVTRRAWKYFAGESDTPATKAAQKTIAAAYERSGLRFDALLTALFCHDEFYSEQVRHGLIRTPVAYVIAAHRAAKISPRPHTHQIPFQEMGQELFAAPTVEGWGLNQYWTGAAATIARQRFAYQFASHVADEHLGKPDQTGETFVTRQLAATA